MKYFIVFGILAVVGFLSGTVMLDAKITKQCKEKAKEMMVTTFKQVCVQNIGAVKSCKTATFESIQTFYRFEKINRPGTDMEKIWEMYEEDLIKCN